MVLVFTFVYEFQKHVAPFTSLLAVRQQCYCLKHIGMYMPRRSAIDIWSCLATIFACSWVSVHPNIPAPNESWWRVLLRRIELMFWAVVGPEMVIAWAFRKWTSARHLEKLYKGELSSLYIKSNAFDLITNRV